MQPLEERPIICPYCGEAISLLVDCSITEHSYVEDCEVCCQPIEIQASVDADCQLLLSVRRSDE